MSRGIEGKCASLCSYSISMQAVDLADRMLPAFDTPSGLPALFVNLKTASAWSSAYKNIVHVVADWGVIVH